MHLPGVILSDTNIILKIILFDKLDICSVDIPGLGKIRFDGIVQREISKWIQDHDKSRKVRKIEKFSLTVVKRALESARKNAQLMEPPTAEIKNRDFKQYEAVAVKIRTNSAPPSENDLTLLYHAERAGCYMLTNDNLMHKLGQKIIGKRSLELEDIFIALLNGKIIKANDVREFAKLLDNYSEILNLTKIFREAPDEEKT